MTSTKQQTPTSVSATAVEQRAEDVGTAMGALASMLVGQQDLPTLLRQVADLAKLTIPGCAAASVTLVQSGRPATVAHTDQLAVEVDRAQYAVDEGPCLDAIRHQRINSVDLGEADERWPDFTEAARRHGVTGALAAPLVAGAEAVGALNLFSTTAAGFDALDDALISMFCAQASVALANAQLYDRAVSLSVQLQEAMVSRSVIEQAKGVLMARDHLSEQEAFDRLREQSQTGNRKLRDVAADVVASTAS